MTAARNAANDNQRTSPSTIRRREDSREGGRGQEGLETSRDSRDLQRKLRNRGRNTRTRARCVRSACETCGGFGIKRRIMRARARAIAIAATMSLLCLFARRRWDSALAGETVLYLIAVGGVATKGTCLSSTFYGGCLPVIGARARARVTCIRQKDVNEIRIFDVSRPAPDGASGSRFKVERIPSAMRPASKGLGDDKAAKNSSEMARDSF